ncbi:hypothetical protein F5J12DRAFT_786041, partial [Pisolithus orientalis]|uniref:uncharacterized protein n=1 Tax=Pisolithus orientalis TaxID=936130 RepID=UPI00222580C1
SIEVVQGGTNTTTSDPACSKEEWSDRNIDIGESEKDSRLRWSKGGQTPLQVIQHALRRSGQMGTLGVQVNVDRGFSSGSMFIGVCLCLLLFVGVRWGSCCCMDLWISKGGQTPLQGVQCAMMGSGQTGSLTLGESGNNGCPSQCGQGLWCLINVHWCLLLFVGVHWCSMGFILLYGPVDVQIRLIEVVRGGMNTASSNPACSEEEWSDGNIGESGKDGVPVNVDRGFGSGSMFIGVWGTNTTCMGLVVPCPGLSTMTNTDEHGQTFVNIGPAWMALSKHTGALVYLFGMH